MSADKTPIQVPGTPGEEPPAPTPASRTGGGESGGGAYKEDHAETGDNREIERPVHTGKEPRE